MNVFSLFETKTLENIKLGIQVVKTLNLEKEFENKNEISFEIYCRTFDKLLKTTWFSCLWIKTKVEMIIKNPILFHFVNYEEFDRNDIVNLSITYSTQLKHFDLDKLHERDLVSVIYSQKLDNEANSLHLLYKYSHKITHPCSIIDVLKICPELVEYLDIDLLTAWDCCYCNGYYDEKPSLFEKQPSLLEYFVMKNIKFIDCFRDVVGIFNATEEQISSLQKIFDFHKMNEISDTDIISYCIGLIPNLINNFDRTFLNKFTTLEKLRASFSDESLINKFDINKFNIIEFEVYNKSLANYIYKKRPLLKKYLYKIKNK